MQKKGNNNSYNNKLDPFLAESTPCNAFLGRILQETTKPDLSVTFSCFICTVSSCCNFRLCISEPSDWWLHGDIVSMKTSSMPQNSIESSLQNDPCCYWKKTNYFSSSFQDWVQDSKQWWNFKFCFPRRNRHVETIAPPWMRSFAKFYVKYAGGILFPKSKKFQNKPQFPTEKCFKAAHLGPLHCRVSGLQGQ